MYATPFVINEAGETENFSRVSFGSGFQESWLQKILFETPQSLPLAEIDPAYQQVCPLCLEMNTGSGPIDIVYITPHGRLVIVEIKLWRNPDARRKVVGQILDYAKELTRWTYSDLQREVSRRTGIKGNAPYTILSKQIDGIQEAAFVDGVSQCLKNGDFMLIIAGDGIRQDAQGIVQFLQEAGNLRFVLALLEVADYKHSQKDYYIIQPRTLVKTQQVDRAMATHVNSDSPVPDRESEKNIEPWRQQYKEYWTKFLESLTLDDPNQPMASPVAMGNLTFSLPPSGAIAWITTYFYKKNKNVGCYVRLINSPTGRDLYQGLLEEKEDIEADLPFKIEWDEKQQTIDRYMHVDSEWPPFDDENISTFLAETINALVNTFRPRLERLSGN
jgi:hypothetical protein